MPKYDVTVTRPRTTHVEVEASNEEEACVKASMFIDKDGAWNYTWRDEPENEVCHAELIKTPVRSKLGKMIDKLASYGMYIQDLYDADNQIYGYLVTADVDPIDYAVGLELTLTEGVDNTAFGFLRMWKAAVRNFNPEVFAWNWLSTLPKDKARESVRNALCYFDDFKAYLRHSAHEMAMYLNTLEHEEDEE